MNTNLIRVIDLLIFYQVLGNVISSGNKSSKFSSIVNFRFCEDTAGARRNALLEALSPTGNTL